MSNEFQGSELDRRYGGSTRNRVVRMSELNGDEACSARSTPTRDSGYKVGTSQYAGFDSSRKPDVSVRPREESRVSREDFELACIREFSHSGHHLGVGVSRAERRERIRVAILRENKERRRWHDTDFTYAEIYAQAYQQKLALEDSPDKKAVAAWASSNDDSSDDEDAVEDGELPIE